MVCLTKIKHFWNHLRLRLLTILRAITKVMNLGLQILEKYCLSVLWFYEAILKNINQRPALNRQVGRQGMMGNPDGQTISRVFIFVIGREEEAYVWSTTDDQNPNLFSPKWNLILWRNHHLSHWIVSACDLSEDERGRTQRCGVFHILFVSLHSNLVTKHGFLNLSGKDHTGR